MMIGMKTMLTTRAEIKTMMDLIENHQNHKSFIEVHGDHKGCDEEDDPELCHQVIDAVQLGLHLGPSSPEIPWLGLIIGILMFYHNICPINIFHTPPFHS